MTPADDLTAPTCGECRYCAARPDERGTLACWSEDSGQNSVHIDIDAEDEACPEFEERDDA